MKFSHPSLCLFIVALSLSLSIAQPEQTRAEATNQPDPKVTELVQITYYTIEAKSSGNALSISQNSRDENANLLEWKDQLGLNRQFQIVPVEGKWVQLVFRHSDRAMAVRDHEKFPVVQRNKICGEASHWRLLPDSDGYIRLLNRSNDRYLTTRNLTGAHGKGAILEEDIDSDRQKFRIKIVDIDYQTRVKGGDLNATAKQITGKDHPTTTAELTDFLDGTSWSVREGSQHGSEIWKFHFKKPGTVTIEPSGGTSYRSLGPATMKLWNYDHAVFTPDYNHFRAINHWDSVYHGVLLPAQAETENEQEIDGEIDITIAF